MSYTRILRILFHSSFAILITWWCFIYLRQSRGAENYWFNLSIAIFGFLSGGACLGKFFRWRTKSPRFAYSILAFSLAVVFQSIGALVFSYYNFSNISEVPYPGVADIFYGAFPLLACLGILLLLGLGRTVEDTVSFPTMLLHTIIPFIVIAVGVSAFLVIVQVRPLNLQSAASPTSFALDLYYNLGDSLILALSFFLLLSLGAYRKIGIGNAVVFLVCGFTTVYLADFFFFYRFNQGLYFIADYPDVFYVSTLYFVSLGILLVNDVPNL